MTGGPRAWATGGTVGDCSLSTMVCTNVLLWITQGEGAEYPATTSSSDKAQSGQICAGSIGSPLASSVTVTTPCPVHRITCPAAFVVTPRAIAICCDVTAMSNARVRDNKRIMVIGYQGVGLGKRGQSSQGRGPLMASHVVLREAGCQSRALVPKQNSPEMQRADWRASHTSKRKKPEHHCSGLS